MSTYQAVPARRSSLVGPIILVGLGVLFLVSNLRPELSVWNLAARYWPFLLIFWGFARLVEYTIGRLSGRPIARPVSGGEIFLAVLICIAGSAMFSAVRGDWRPLRITNRGLEVLGENYDFPIEARREIPPNATLVIHNLTGNVNVIGSDVKEMRITGRKQIRAMSRSSAEEADKTTPLDIELSGERIVVRTNQDRLPGDRRISTDLEVSVPKTVALALEGRYGDFDVRDVAGPVEVTSANAGVRINNIIKDVKVTLKRSDVVRATQLKGNIEISGRGQDIELEKIAGTATLNGDFTGVIRLQDLAKPVRYASSRTELSFERLPGRLELDGSSVTVTDVVGPLRLAEVGQRSRGRDIRIDGFSQAIEISARRGDIELRTNKLPLANIQITTSHGSIALEVPANAQFQLQGRTGHGRADNQFGNALKVEEQGKSAAEMSGGSAAGAKVRLNTDRGDISVRKTGTASV